MAIDTSAGQVAMDQLNGIPFGKLIGEPLMAAVRAQNEAAMSTTKFINDVGFNINPKTGKKDPINVVFSYFNDGEMVNLVVPILAILPIPYIAIEEININFKANISASASQESEENKSRDADASLGVSGGSWWGKANFNASVSSKSSSRATQSSKYSVEYTMDIHVRAIQEGMPAGMAKILNMITESVTSTPADGAVKLIPVTGTSVPINAKTADAAVLSDPDKFIKLDVLLTDGELKPIADQSITKDDFSVYPDVVDLIVEADGDATKTDKDGKIKMKLAVKYKEGNTNIVNNYVTITVEGKNSNQRGNMTLTLKE